ncbi:MAG: glycosyl hydrolase, partial [Maribacter sp.]|nr:glycosyl hydrolase [Maribacter sp.]
GMLYAGVDNGIYISTNDGTNWMRLRNNLPPAPVYWLEIQERFDDLVVGTYGRGFYILDNISPLREFDLDANGNDAHLFSLRQAYRFHNKQSIKTDGPSNNSGRNPAYGADINYYLKDSTDQKVEIQILDANDEIIRTLKGKNGKGIHRTMWDLRYEPTYKPKLRSTPPGRPWVELNGEGWRPLVTWDLDLWRGQFGPRAVPDLYKVKLIIGEKEYVRELEVLKDPVSEGSLESIKEQVAFSLELRDAMNLAVTMINDIETIREELNEIIPSLKRSSDIEKATELRNMAQNIAGSLYDIHLTGAREDAFRSPMKLYGRLSALASDIGGHGIDFKPTDQQREVYTLFNQRLKNVDTKFKNFMKVEVKQLNAQLKKSKLQIQVNKKIKS